MCFRPPSATKPTKCINCGTFNMPSNTSCKKCGAQLPVEKTPCPKCGVPQPLSNKVCANCGFNGNPGSGDPAKHKQV